MVQEYNNSEERSDRTKRLGLLMQQLLGNASYTNLPQPMQRYILSQVVPLLDNPSITAQSAIALALREASGLIEGAKSNIAEQEKNKEATQKINELYEHHGRGLDALSFKQLAVIVANDDRTFESYKAEIEKLDEWRKKRNEWTEEQAYTAKPEELQKHLAELQAEAALRETIIKQEEKTLAHKEEVIKAMARKENISANTIEEVHEKISRIAPTQRSENMQVVEDAAASYIKQKQNVVKHKDQLKNIKGEIAMADAVRQDRGIPAPTKEHFDAAFSFIKQETNIGEQRIADAKNELARTQQEKKIAEKEVSTVAAIEESAMKELCEMIRDKLPGTSETTTPREYMAAIEVNPTLMQDEEVAFVYGELQAAYLGKSQEQTSKPNSMPPINGEGQKTLENISQTIKKSWTESIQPASQPSTSRGNNPGRWL